MKLSTGFWQTYKEIPSEAEIPSHQLMLRAGLIHKTSVGIYSFLPMGLRALRKVEKIVREELDKINCFEVNMSVVTPGELWKETGRWEVFGPQMLKIKDRGERDLCISPTNEESVTDIFRKTVKSYKQLPLTLYQINTKFRDEIRPRFGVMRGREFLMMDAYSFHSNKTCLEKIYFDLFGAYEQIFRRMGLDFIAVEADAGAMAEGDAKTHEFQVLAGSGEDIVIKCNGCKYAANIEKSKTIRADEGSISPNVQELQPIEEIPTPDKRTIQDVCSFFGMPESCSLKSLVYKSYVGRQEEFYLLLLRGDDTLNELKIKSQLKRDVLIPATEADMEKLDLLKGYIGPRGIPSTIKVVYDLAVNANKGFVVGANKAGFHLKNFVPVRDGNSESKFLDMREAKEGDVCAQCKKEKVVKVKGIEVGHIFQLGDKYTRSMKATVLDKDGKAIYPLMGCYGIGVSRTVAAAIEQFHDKNGIIWPKSIAPYHVYLCTVGKGENIRIMAREIYEDLIKENIEVVLDDRDVGPGVIFKDADLLGLPIRLLVGEKDWNEKGAFEIKMRKSGEITWVKRDNLVSEISRLLKE